MVRRPFLGLFVGLLCYGAIALLVFAACGFVQGTMNFAAWGEGGRFGAVFCTLIAWLFAVVPLEAVELRQGLVDALADHLERDL